MVAKTVNYARNIGSNEKRSLNYYISRCIVIILISVIFLAPARFYISFSLTREAASNIVVNYVNAVDIIAIIVAAICLLATKNKTISTKSATVVGFYLVIALIDSCALFLYGYSAYTGELLSKTILIICGAIIAEYISKELDDSFRLALYILPIIVLVLATFFLTGYGGYALTNRAGTLGFGSNETAMFACVLIGIALVSTFNPWLKLGMTLLGLACVLTVSSRRGIFVAIAIIFLNFLIKLLKKKKKYTPSQLLLATASAVVVLFLINRYYWRIYDYVIHSPLVVRFNYSARVGIDFFDTSDRGEIFRDCIARLNEKPFLGFMGADKLFAQNTFTHTHNLLLQSIVIYGYFFGTIIALYFVVVAYRAIRILIWSQKDLLQSKSGAVYSIFYVLYFVFDMYGYLLWNPKGVLWIMITSFLINLEYKKTKNRIGEFGVSNQRVEI